MRRLELWEKGVGGISLRGGGERGRAGKGEREEGELYGFLCRMRASSLASISFGERL